MRIARRFFSVFLTLLLASPEFLYSLSSQEVAPKPLLWQVGGPEGQKAYLLGSIHFADESFYPLPEPMRAAFAASDVLAVEVDPSGDNQLALQQKMLSAGMLGGGESLKTVLSAQNYQKLTTSISKIGLPQGALDRFKPWFAALSITSMLLLKQGYRPEMGVDMHFIEQAKKLQMPVVELESADFQIDMLDGFSKDEQQLFLVYTLADLDVMEGELLSLFEAWKFGKADVVEEIVTGAIHEQPELVPIYEQLIFHRNETMAKKVETYLASDQVHFVVVGAAHLVGERGIPALLQKAGYQVAR